VVKEDTTTTITAKEVEKDTITIREVIKVETREEVKEETKVVRDVLHIKEIIFFKNWKDVSYSKKIVKKCALVSIYIMSRMMCREGEKF